MSLSCYGMIVIFGCSTLYRRYLLLCVCIFVLRLNHFFSNILTHKAFINRTEIQIMKLSISLDQMTDSHRDIYHQFNSSRSLDTTCNYIIPVLSDIQKLYEWSVECCLDNSFVNWLAIRNLWYNHRMDDCGFIWRTRSPHWYVVPTVFSIFTCVFILRKVPRSVSMFKQQRIHTLSWSCTW